MSSQQIISLLKRSQCAMFSTGAGMSSESGVPTFRGAGGLWNDFKPEELATPQAFARDPQKVWQWYDWRRQLLKTVTPNAGHYALAAMEKLLTRMVLFTQNIDGLHQLAGSKLVHELHGNIWNVRCTAEQRQFPLNASPLPELPPRCECGTLLRPDVVWFGESLPQDIIDLGYQAARRCDIFFLIGSSATVQPAASLAWMAKENGAVLIEINPEDTAVSSIADESLRGKSGEILPQLLQALQNG